MSTGYSLIRKVSARDLFDGRLDEYGVREHIEPGKTSQKERCLTDGENYITVSIDDDGSVSVLTRYGGILQEKFSMLSPMRSIPILYRSMSRNFGALPQMKSGTLGRRRWQGTKMTNSISSF
jgi:hypothetical protein